MNFLAKVENGRIKLNAPDYVREQCKKLEGRRIILSVVEPKRSLSQNNYYWGAYLPIISQETGHTTEELHAYFKQKFLPTQYATVKGVEVVIEKSTADLNKAEFAEYLMNIEAETGIASPNPEDAGYIVNKKVIGA